MNIRCSGGSKSFAKETKALKMSTVASHQSWQQPRESKLILLQLHEKLPTNNADHSTIVQHLKQIGNVKKLSKTVPKELTTNFKKIVIFKCHLLLVCATTANHFFIGMWCVTKCALYTTASMTASSVVGPRRSSTAILAPKKVMVTVWWSTANLMHYSFLWIPPEPIHLRSLLNISMRCTENCSACSWHWSTERAQFFSTTTLDHTLRNQHFRNWTNWAKKFCLICHIHLTSC